MVLSDDLVGAVAEGLQEVVVGRHDRAVQLEDDDGLGSVDGGHHTLSFTELRRVGCRTFAAE